MLADKQIEPWYRQFWPWFLIALPATVVVAGLATVVIATRHADDLVVDDYYKDGLAINRTLEKLIRAQALELSATVNANGRRIEVLLTGDNRHSILLLLLSHPMEADRDVQIELMAEGGSLFIGESPAQVAANWHWSLQPALEPEWRLDGTLEAGQVSDDTQH
ncbi:MAG: hypothetical protein ACI9GW_000272 [Halieaceae bacterium]|jgi:hypothetical protein